MVDPACNFAEWKQEVELALERRLPPPTTRPQSLHAAIRYSMLAGGKRLRPLLCLAACEAVGGHYATAMPAALALEALHTYTLIHDDLPCMDNDTLRRGKPSCHVAFGEATALLAGDALLTMAFEWLAGCTPPAPFTLGDLVRELTIAAGSRGVIAGQVEDLAAEGTPSAPDTVEYIHQHKTAALITAAVRIGGMLGGATPGELDILRTYGQSVGLAFQIADDILNATSSAEALGKSAGSDSARRKTTYVAVFGLAGAQKQAADCSARGREALRDLTRGPARALTALADYAITRTV